MTFEPSSKAPPPSHRLESYLSRLVLERIADGGDLGSREVTRMPAALLLTDISGFTALVSRFSEAGSAGLEALTWGLNQYVADLVEVVYMHGGDVLSIAGDAFLCSWAATSEADLPNAVARAAQAALAIQARLHGRAIGESPLATRVGVGAGELAVAFAGGVGGRWELIVAGDVVGQVVSAERQCVPGRVTLSSHAWSLLASRGSGRRVPNDLVELVRIEQPGGMPAVSDVAPLRVDDTRLRSFVPPAVLDRVLAPRAEWLAEFRRVSVLLAELPGLGRASAVDVDRTHHAIRAFQEVVARFEGTAKVDVDDKGILTLGVFGVPPLAHEDDAERAVQAAMALKEALAGLGVWCGIGVATGRVLCGAFGSDRRRDYMLRGPVINLAARLMHVSRDDVTCDVTTTQSVRQRLQFAELAPVALKGHANPVPVFRPSGRALGGRRYDAPMVGRVGEREELHREVASIAGGAGRIVVIEADAGLGKSRLVADAVGEAATAGVRVITAAADAIERSTAYYAWRSPFATIFELTADQDAVAIRAAIDRRMAAFPELERLVPLLSAVLPVQIPDNELTAEMTGDVRADNTRTLLVRILQSVASATPLLLVVEDAHWLDSTSWSLLVEIARTVQPLLIVVATRPPAEPVPTEHVRLVQMPSARVMRLEGLTADDTVALMANRLGVRTVPDALAAFVQERVSGHPFFCEELLQTMLESDAIRVRDGVCTVGDLQKLEIPTTVEGVILSRLDRLTPGQQLCVKIAAVIGRVFRYVAVRDTHPVEVERPRVGHHLSELARLELTLPDAPEPDLAYIFKHVITRDVAYGLMSLAQRQPLHRAAAEWYEKAYGDDLAPHYALLAYHWARAADPTKTVEYLEKAGLQAVRGGAFREAILFLTQAIEAQDSGAVPFERVRRGFWEKGLGLAHYYLGDLQLAQSHLERAVGLLDRPIPKGSTGMTLGALRAAAEQAAHRLFPARYDRRRIAEKKALDDAVECYCFLGQLYYLDGEGPPWLVYSTVRGVNAGEEAGPSSVLARVLSNMATLLTVLGRNTWADWYAARAIGMAEREGHYSAGAHVWNINALMHAQRARWSEAHAANQKAIALVRELGDYNIEPEAHVTASTVSLVEGNLLTAAPAWTRLLELAERNGNAQIKCWALAHQAVTLLGRGEDEAAGEVLEKALAVETSEKDFTSSIEKLRALTLTRLRQRRTAEAVEAADAIVEMIVRQPPAGYHFVDYCASAVEVYLSVLEGGADYARANGPSLERRIRKGCKLLKRLSGNFWNVRPTVPLLEGKLHWHQGEHDRALADWGRARDIAVSMNMPFHEARVLFEMGRHATGTTGQQQLTRAVEIFERLGATHLASRARAARSGETRSGARASG